MLGFKTVRDVFTSQGFSPSWPLSLSLDSRFSLLLGFGIQTLRVGRPLALISSVFTIGIDFRMLLSTGLYFEGEWYYDRHSGLS